MAVTFLYSDTLRNKDEYLFLKMKKDLENGKNIVYIVPEQYSFLADKLLLTNLTEKFSHLTETLNFKRMSYLINDKYNKNGTNFIDEETKNLILYRILRENIGQLSLKKSKQISPDTIAIYKDMIDELKRNLIDIETLTEIKSKSAANPLLASKLNDLILIMKSYDFTIQNRYKDFEDSFVILANNIEKYNLYKDYTLYIDAFSSFTKSEFLVINSLMKNCENINFTLLIDNFDAHNIGDLFYPTYATYDDLKKISEKNHQLILDVEIPTAPCPNAIKLTNAKTQNDEVRSIIKTIKNLLLQGHCFSDMMVLTGDLSVYSDSIENHFLLSDIPFFMDKRVPLVENPISKLLLSPLNMIISNYHREEVIEYLKSTIFLFDNHIEVCIFEEFITKYSITKYKISNPEQWKKNVEIIKKINKTIKWEIIETIYNFFIRPIVENFPTNKETISSFAIFNGYKNYIQFAKLEKKLKFAEMETKKECINAYNIFINSLKNMNHLLANDPISIQDYYSLCIQSLSLYTTGVIPNTIDKVTVSDVNRGRDEMKKFVFILGLNDGITPKSNVNNSFISDYDREFILDVCGIELATSIWKNASNELNLYKATVSYSHTLFLSKSEKCDDQTRLMPCFLWNEYTLEVENFHSEFVNLHELAIMAIKNTKNPYIQNKSQHIAEKLQNIPEIKQLFANIDDLKEYPSQNKKLDKKLLDSKYNKKLNSSVSRLESYQKCGYSYFIKYILKINEKENNDYDSKKVGSIVHNLIDSVSKQLKVDNKSWEDIDVSYIDTTLETLATKEIKRAFPELSIFNPRTKYLIGKLKRATKTAILYIKEHFINGDFIPIGYEIEVSETGVPPLKILLEDHSIMYIYGKIDRADMLRQDDKLYIRIIDYKSSKKEFNFALIKDGIQLQLITYLKTLIENGHEYFDFKGDIMPGAAFYVSFDDALLTFPYKPAADEVIKKFKEKFSLKGLILNDDRLITAIDKNLENNPQYKSEICEVKTNKEGNFSMKNLLFLNEFNKLLEDCKNSLKDIGSKITNGDIKILPYKYGSETGCDYCSYKSVCLFDHKMHKYRTVGKLTKDEYFEV